MIEEISPKMHDLSFALPARALPPADHDYQAAPPTRAEQPEPAVVAIDLRLLF